ncbi:hypothetical protein [Larkinella soli]|uniref:hypothetical protein n=1 Tax=Larkinella soli TaxID=1770527 RepID=UPI000FFB4D56|nr:hypothetical protein [Larkinella soli]
MTTILIFLITFLPFGWFLYKALRFTARTLGDESPLKTRVSFTITPGWYFSRMQVGLILFLLSLCIGLLFVIPNFPVEKPIHSLYKLLLFLIDFALIGLAVLGLRLKTGRQLFITNMMPTLQFALDEYFAGVPMTVEYQNIPWIRTE